MKRIIISEGYKGKKLSDVNEKRDFVKKVQERNGISNQNIDMTEYPPISGMEGPFRYRSGFILYYDPKNGQYYDRKKDIYLSTEEAMQVTMSSKDNNIKEAQLYPRTNAPSERRFRSSVYFDIFVNSTGDYNQDKLIARNIAENSSQKMSYIDESGSISNPYVGQVFDLEKDVIDGKI